MSSSTNTSSSLIISVTLWQLEVSASTPAASSAAMSSATAPIACAPSTTHSTSWRLHTAASCSMGSSQAGQEVM